MAAWVPVTIDTLPDAHPLRGGTENSLLVRAMRGERTRRRPIWFMRQAGRSLPEYRSLRAGTAMLDACLTPELATEITLQPVRRHDVDAAVLFSDIVVPLKLAGIGVEIVPGTGPVVADPVRTREQIAALPELDPAALAPIEQAVAGCVSQLGEVPLVGFAGAPFTLASYLVEGGPSRDHLRTKAMMLGDPQTWAALATWVGATAATFLRAQILAGASAVQLFDSWAGNLSSEQYAAGAAPFSAQVFAAVSDLAVPRVHFGVGTGELLPAMHTAGADVIGVDHRITLDQASRRLGGTVPLQGNIDPALLFAGERALREHVLDVLAAGQAAPGHVVNLGHGVPPDTDPDVLTRLVEFVHAQPDPLGR
jgi:uroporphyrinogen decarboxylase